MARELSGPEYGPHAGGEPKSLVLLLHGWGADGDDLIGLAPHWAPLLPDAVFLSPNGPEPCEAGFGLRWFSLEDRTASVQAAGAATAADDINAYLDAQMARFGIAADKVAFCGFSQGTMMSLYVAPRRDEQVACVLGYSGRLVGGETLEQDIKRRPPVMLIHGDADELVPVANLPLAADALTAAGMQVETHVRPGLGHGIDPEGLALGGNFLKSVLG